MTCETCGCETGPIVACGRCFGVESDRRQTDEAKVSDLERRLAEAEAARDRAEQQRDEARADLSISEAARAKAERERDAALVCAQGYVNDLQSVGKRLTATEAERDRERAARVAAEADCAALVRMIEQRADEESALADRYGRGIGEAPKQARWTHEARQLALLALLDEVEASQHPGAALLEASRGAAEWIAAQSNGAEVECWGGGVDHLKSTPCSAEECVRGRAVYAAICAALGEDAHA